MPALKDHELSCIFPLLSDADLAALADDIEANGLGEPIVLFEGKILDGRNRYRACMSKGIDPRTIQFDGADPLAFVLSKNLHRRHLTESQRAMVAAELANMRHGGNRKDQAANLPLDRTQAEAAEMLNVSGRSVRTAKHVIEEAEPEIVEAVKAGDIPVSTAAKVADLPAKEQRKIAKSKEPAKAAREAVKKKEAKPEPVAPAQEEAEPPADSIEAFVGSLNKLCKMLDGWKKMFGEAIDAYPLGRKFVHVESITLNIDAARKALWQSRPTNECNCTRTGGSVRADCKACHGCGKCAASRVLKGSR